MEPVGTADFSIVVILLKDIPASAWVALSSDNRLLLASGSDMRSVLIEARKAGEYDPILLRVPR